MNAFAKAALGYAFALLSLRVMFGGVWAIGAALAAAGAAYQSLFRNPLVSPDILGVSGGAAVGAVLGIFFALPILAIQGLAFAFGLVAVALVMLIASAVRGHDPLLVLVLAGVLVGALLGACVALMKVLADPYNQITFWLLGSLAGAAPADLAAAMPAIALGFVPLWLLRWRVNLLSLGDEEARAMGVETTRVRLAVIAAATLMTAAAVSVAGIVGWIGLVIPHFARLAVGPDFGRLLPVSALLGAAFLLAVDTLARSTARIEIPLGVLTAFVGTPLFLWQLVRSRRSWQ
jgi:iron complex transport system permease protein